MKCRILPLVLATGFSFFQAVNAQDGGAVSKWGTDYQQSVNLAKENGKDVLLVFTAGDDIKICKVFDNDILNQPAFTDLMSTKFELVRLEYPTNDKEQPLNLKVQNNLLKRAYRISGYPVILATDTEGRPFGMNGFQPVKPDEYAGMMITMADTKAMRDEKFAQAAAATGVEKAKIMAEAIPQLPGNLMGRYYRPQMQVVIDNDPKNETGMAETFRRVLADVDYSQKMESLGQDVQWGKMIELTEQYIADNKLEGVDKQKALLNKFAVQQRQKNLPGAIETLIQVKDIDEESPFGKQAIKVLESLRAQKLQENLVE